MQKVYGAAGGAPGGIPDMSGAGGPGGFPGAGAPGAGKDEPSVEEVSVHCSWSAAIC